MLRPDRQKIKWRPMEYIMNIKISRTRQGKVLRRRTKSEYSANYMRRQREKGEMNEKKKRYKLRGRIK